MLFNFQNVSTKVVPARESIVVINCMSRQLDDNFDESETTPR